MSKLSARDIQIFVAGALAFLGFDSIVLGTNALIHSLIGHAVSDFIVGGMVLLLGVAIFAGNMRAIRWVQVFLWLGIIQDVISIWVFAFRKFGVPHMTLYQAISSLLELSALLCLIALSRSRRFRHEPDA